MPITRSRKCSSTRAVVEPDFARDAAEQLALDTAGAVGFARTGHFQEIVRRGVKVCSRYSDTSVGVATSINTLISPGWSTKASLLRLKRTRRVRSLLLARDKGAVETLLRSVAVPPRPASVV